jgi:GT2 family glycosyltransferase
MREGISIDVAAPPITPVRRTTAAPEASVVVTTYRRPELLSACLAGVRSQSRSADEVVVVVHALDRPSVDVLESLLREWPALRCERVDRHGSVAALNCGLAAARGSIVAFTDDDAVPEPDWLEQIVRTFDQDERIAAVGGRDVIVVDGRVVDAPRPRRRSAEPPPQVGQIQWFGRMIANHHLGSGAARDVDVLKGVNMSFRRSTVLGHGFDERLRGVGAIVHSELSVCLPLRRRGLRIVYDPAIVVRHYPAPRPHGDERGEVVFCASHNEAVAILDYFGPLRRLVFMAWACAIGSTDTPGLAVTVRDTLRGRTAPWPRFLAAQRGGIVAWRTRRTPRPAPSAAKLPAAMTGNADSAG